ncbi:hypothetical protein BDN72DRAFT_583878 [Pluteus cervinus]|uniref:Uncharacterized protein n=1 Tax=Pluteus cervinus TaxID=181527 RepID=A0ACD3AWA7_9AGAR|nr:hypothetical protein BDN72DRAFT_583878 [Pluteus cervinus]
MQDCRYANEILRNIVDFAFADEEKGASTLASLASTSKILHIHAVGVLWQVLPNIKPLLMCMPKNIWKTPPRLTDTVEGGYKLARLPCADDWSRCNNYAARVLWLGYSHFSKPLTGDIWRGVLPHTRLVILGGLSLPNLRHICWHTTGYTVETLLLSPVLISRGLVELDIGVQEGPSSLCALFNTLRN